MSTTQANEIKCALTPFKSASEAKKPFLNYASPEMIWQEHRESTKGRDLDITGLTYAQLEKAPQQWPFKPGDTQGKARLYEDGIFPTTDGKAKFAAVAYKPVAEPRESRYPFSLNTGRLRDQWHGMSRTGTLGRLFGHVPEPVVQMNAQDMSRRLLSEGDLVHVTSKRGSIVLPVQASSEVNVTQAFIAMHWGSEYLSGRSSSGERIGGINAITTSSYCPTAKQPELKHAAVKILKAELPWHLLAVAWLPESSAHTARAELLNLMARFEFSSCTPFGREDAAQSTSQGVSQCTPREAEPQRGLLFRAAANYAPEDDSLARIEALLGLSSIDTLRYEDKKRGQRRAARLVRTSEGNAKLQGFLLAGDISAEGWIKTLLQDELDAQTYGRLLLAPGAKAPIAIQSKGNQVCACFNVSESEITGFLKTCEGSDTEQLSSLQTQLKCGTNCGSCVPQLKKIIRVHTAQTAPSTA